MIIILEKYEEYYQLKYTDDLINEKWFVSDLFSDWKEIKYQKKLIEELYNN